MEIISYVNQSTFRSLTKTEYTPLSLNELLHKQRKFRNSLDLNLDFELVFDSLNKNAKIFAECFSKLKWCILTVILACIGACLISFGSLVVKSIPKTASFSSAMEIESELIANAMNSLVLDNQEIDYLEDGTLFISDEIKNFTEPVTYSDYTVKSGESISSISKKFALSNISTLISVNNISNARALRSGQKIIIPSIDGIVHTVKKGDTLDKIATANKVTIESLLDVNDISTEILTVGQRIFIPGVALDKDTLKQSLGELFIKPIAIKYRISSAYGYRPDPFTGVRSFHTGLDMAVPQGTSIRSAMDGKVIDAGWNNVYGNYIIINHSNGYQTLYAHMTKYVVKLGQTVNQGTQIGFVGSTGYSTGPHLHFAVYKNGKHIDPATVLK